MGWEGSGSGRGSDLAFGLEHNNTLDCVPGGPPFEATGEPSPPHPLPLSPSCHA